MNFVVLCVSVVTNIAKVQIAVTVENTSFLHFALNLTPLFNIRYHNYTFCISGMKKRKIKAVM